ncbi:hypothetical protein K490DRAFT_66736 [Saccharata proteae CBS 121410]|uniref:Uncharacterized protein n=1 Tax=Saccharata proteae CBS 121410 TaxID=1314787 RepID=A0A9P4HV77_9PEZI|nr:hypothetical protein K490DRAFT_66736 [Saccharata proteae CBS 121410]
MDHPEVDWKGRWFPNGNDCRETQDAKEAVVSYREFRKSLPPLGKKIKSELNIYLSKSSSNSKEKTVEQDKLFDALETMSVETLEQYASIGMNDMGRANSNLRRQREHGSKKITTGFQKFSRTFEDFLKAYSGILGILQVADSQYGNTVKIKTGAEDSITACMRNIVDALPKLQSYRNVYPDPRLGALLSRIYKDIIEFSEEAVTFFIGPGFQRYSHSLGKPYKFQAIERGMRDNFTEVRHLCDVLLAERVQRLAEQNRALESKLDMANEELLKANQELLQLKESFDSKSVTELRNYLNLPHFSNQELASHLQKYRLVLKDSFGHRKCFHPFTLNDLEAMPAYQSWFSIAAPTTATTTICTTQTTPPINTPLLILFGRNDSELHSETNSWLSPIALDLIDKLRTSSHPVAYCLCTRIPTARLKSAVLASILLQLVEAKPDTLRSGADLRYILSQRLSHTDEETKSAAICNALVRVLQRYDKSVYIVIDRPESFTNQSRALFLRSLVTVAKEVGRGGGGQGVRVLVVQRSEFWDVERNIGDVVVEEGDRELLVLVRRDQRRVEGSWY